MTPRTIRPSTSSATCVPHSRPPLTNWTVPSIGSSSHRRPSTDGATSPDSSDSTPSPGRSRASTSSIAASAAQSALLTGLPSALASWSTTSATNGCAAAVATSASSQREVDVGRRHPVHRRTLWSAGSPSRPHSGPSGDDGPRLTEDLPADLAEVPVVHVGGGHQRAHHLEAGWATPSQRRPTVRCRLGAGEAATPRWAMMLRWISLVPP